LKERSPKGIAILINTHHHGDHVAGNPVFRKVVKQIVQQENCAKYHKSTTAENAAQQAYADVAFGESWSTSLGNEKVWAYFDGPGHTGGDAVIVFERANVVHMGDLMFNRLHPFIDRPNGASIRNWIRILERVAAKHRDATFIFGHSKDPAAVTGPAKELLYFRDYLSAALELTQKAIKSGQSQAEIAKTSVLPGFPDHASPMALLSLPNVLKVAYAELTNQK
jgi:cyclase